MLPLLKEVRKKERKTGQKTNAIDIKRSKNIAITNFRSEILIYKMKQIIDTKKKAYLKIESDNYCYRKVEKLLIFMPTNITLVDCSSK